MELENLTQAYQRSNRILLSIEHFARGYYPTDFLGDKPISLNVNRLFFVLENRNGDACCIGDAVRKFPLRAGDIFLAPIYHPSIFRLDDGLRFVSIQFRLEMFSGVDLLAGLPQIWHTHDRERVQKISALFDAPDSPLLPLALKRIVYSTVEEVLAAFPQGHWDEAARFAPFDKLLGWINLHCTARTRVAEFAQVMNLSRTAFVRKFKQETGITPKHFFDRCLTARASRLLTRPDKTVRETADELQFSSDFVFSRYFKKQTGLTPGQFVRQAWQ